jgi:hypothetical protein
MTFPFPIPGFGQQGPTPQVPPIAQRPQRAHTPEPNPDHNIGYILQNPQVPVQVGGQNVMAPLGYDVVVDMQLAYDVVSPECPTGIRSKQRTGHNGAYTDTWVHLWGRVNKGGRGVSLTLRDPKTGIERQFTSPACMGITLRGDSQLLQAATQLKRGHVVSFTGRLAVGTRLNGAPDIFLNATSFYDVKSGEIKVALQAAPISVPQSVMPQATAAPQYIPVQPVAEPAPAEPPAVADPSVSPF